MKRYRIASIASEVAPFSKTGGLADVARSLPKSLKRLGHDVIVITPYYKKAIDGAAYGLKKMYADVPLTFPNDRERTVSYYRGYLMPGLPIYFVSCDRYFGRKKTIYGSEEENKRYYVFATAALTLLLLLKFTPDIVHSHDWHTGLIPELLKKQFKKSDSLGNAATVFTIHNLAFQLGHNWWEIPGPKRDNGLTALPEFEDARHLERINFAKRAILHADVINAVSETYANEILEKKFGQDLHRILQNRKHKLFGVVNGIDYNEYNPAQDPGLAVTYDVRTLARKKKNKTALQKRLGLEQNPDACVIVMTSRISEQKGFDILLPLIPELMKLNTQFAIMGDGDKTYVQNINRLIKQFPNRIALISFDEHPEYETMLYAGGDLSLFPSRFEPCGTGQLKSFRYGCIPVARAIGGLSDTVQDYHPLTGEGNGFVFTNYDTQSFLVALVRAYTNSRHSASWKKLMKKGMRQANSWELPAQQYVELYERAIAFKQASLE